MDKECSKCKLKKPFVEFTKNSTKKDGLHNSCRECKKRDQRQWYENHKDSQKQRVKAYRLKLGTYIKEAKNTPCTDCGHSYPSYVMDFDHLYDKSFSLSNGHWYGSLQRIIEEIKKCEVVCANCHRERTHSRFSNSIG